MTPEEEKKGDGEQPSEEELRAQLEEEIKKVRIEDVVLQSLVSILNLTARRIAKDDERDLDQAKVGIDAGKALVELVSPDAQSQVRQALSELQVLYAKHAGEAEEPPDSGDEKAEDEKAKEPPKKEQPKGKKDDSGLWTPG